MAYENQRDVKHQKANGKKGWQGSGGLVIGGDNVVHFQADFDAPGYYTVQFDVQFPADKDIAQLVLARAEVIWNVEGNFVRRLISIGQGASISGSGQGVAVNIFDWSQALIPPFDYFVSGQVSKGTRPTGARPPILQNGPLTAVNADPDRRGASPNVAVASNDTITYVIPPNAGVTAVLVNARSAVIIGGAGLLGNDVSIQQISGIGGTNLDNYNYDNCGEWIPLSAAATAVAVKNTSSAGERITLYWGVEG